MESLFIMADEDNDQNKQLEEKQTADNKPTKEVNNEEPIPTET